MKFISMWQPWGSLWLSPAKMHETRHWPIKHRGWLGVHAAKKFVRDVDAHLEDILDAEFGHHWGLDLPTGALIGVVNIVACKPTEQVYGGNAPGDIMCDDFSCGDFTAGRFAWQRGDYRRFERPIPYRGSQGFFEVPDSLLPALEAA